MNLPEIKYLDEKGKNLGFDTPETKEQDRPLNLLMYCFGFSVDKKGHLYYALNIIDASDAYKNKYYVLHFDKNGNFLEKIILKKDKKPVRVKQIFINDDNIRYGIGFMEKEAILFKF